MWAGRGEHVGLRDVLLVPPDVRRKMAAVLPAAEYTIYGLSWHHAGAVTNQEEAPYELYLPYSTARNRPETVAALAGSKAAARDRLVAKLPRHADASLPVCRDVWSFSRGRAWRRSAVDVLFGSTPGAFPLVANVFLFSESDVCNQDFTRPVSVEVGVPLTFDR